MIYLSLLKHYHGDLIFLRAIFSISEIELWKSAFKVYKIEGILWNFLWENLQVNFNRDNFRGDHLVEYLVLVSQTLNPLHHSDDLSSIKYWIQMVSIGICHFQMLLSLKFLFRKDMVLPSEELWIFMWLKIDFKELVPGNLLRRFRALKILCWIRSVSVAMCIEIHPIKGMRPIERSPCSNICTVILLILTYLISKWCIRGARCSISGLTIGICCICSWSMDPWTVNSVKCSRTGT